VGILTVIIRAILKAKHGIRKVPAENIRPQIKYRLTASPIKSENVNLLSNLNSYFTRYSVTSWNNSAPITT